jgi:predicted Zn-dependent protease
MYHTSSHVFFPIHLPIRDSPFTMQALEKDPGDTTAREERILAQNAHKKLGTARAAMEGGEFDKASTLLSGLVDTCPGATNFKLMRVDAYMSQNKLDEAGEV